MVDWYGKEAPPLTPRVSKRYTIHLEVPLRKGVTEKLVLTEMQRILRGVPHRVKIINTVLMDENGTVMPDV